MKKIICIFFMCTFLVGFSQVDTISWQLRDSLPSIARVDYGSFLIDSNFYVVGGVSSSFQYFSEVWKYNISVDQWQQMRNFPGGPVGELTAFSINGNGYICSGIDSITGYNNDNEFWEYYPSVDSWQHKPNFPGVGRESPISFVYNDKAYVGLGLGADDLWEYDPSTAHWSQLSVPSCGSRTQCGVAVIDSFVYVIAGFEYSNSFNDQWRYDIAHDHWDSIGIMPGLLRGNSIFWNFGKFLIGGYGILQDSAGNASLGSDVYRYIVGSNTWDTITCIDFVDSTAGGGEGAFVIGTKGYFLGGYKTVNPGISLYRNMWSYDASKLFPPDTTTVGIQTANDNNYGFKLYPNPVDVDQDFQIATSESGRISFYNSLGQVLYITAFQSGTNAFKSSQLNCNNELIFYKAQLDSGPTVTGKLLIE